MKKVYWLSFVSLIFLVSTVFSQADSGDYKVITVKEGENINTIAKKYLKSTRFKKDVLKYNRLSESKVKPGIKLKITV